MTAEELREICRHFENIQSEVKALKEEQRAQVKTILERVEIDKNAIIYYLRGSTLSFGLLIIGVGVWWPYLKPFLHKWIGW